MEKYIKVDDIDVLRKYNEIQNLFNEKGLWCDYVSINHLTKVLKVSKYRIQKAYKSLKNKGYIEKIKIPTYCEEYYNGLYDVSIPILYTQVYVISNKGKKYLEEA